LRSLRETILTTEGKEVIHRGGFLNIWCASYVVCGSNSLRLSVSAVILCKAATQLINPFFALFARNNINHRGKRGKTQRGFLE